MNFGKTENQLLKSYLPELIQLRHNLHKHPELSGQEKNTSQLIIEYISQYHPDQIITEIAGHGFAVVFNGKKPGPTVMFSCELDALPIEEMNDFSYRSTQNHVSHKCGHDGHMASVTALVPLLSQAVIEKGRVVLLYRPAEETGQGASLVISDLKYRQMKPDYVFAFHNLPGFPLGHIVIKPDVMNWTASGMVIHLTGKTSHAAHPENGISPAIAMCNIMEEIHQLTTRPNFNAQKNSCIIGYARLGEKSLGRSPANAEIGFIIRSETDNGLSRLFNYSKEIVEKHAVNYSLGYTIEGKYKFNATFNSEIAVSLVEQAAHDFGYTIIQPKQAMKWADDIGELISRSTGAYFCIGSGEQSAQLHNPDYDFPDSLIEIAGNVFFRIAQQILTIQT